MQTWTFRHRQHLQEMAETEAHQLGPLGEKKTSTVQEPNRTRKKTILTADLAKRGQAHIFMMGGIPSRPTKFKLEGTWRICVVVITAIKARL